MAHNVPTYEHSHDELMALIDGSDRNKKAWAIREYNLRYTCPNYPEVECRPIEIEEEPMQIKNLLRTVIELDPKERVDRAFTKLLYSRIKMLGKPVRFLINKEALRKLEDELYPAVTPGRSPSGHAEPGFLGFLMDVPTYYDDDINGVEWDITTQEDKHGFCGKDEGEIAV